MWSVAGGALAFVLALASVPAWAQYPNIANAPSIVVTTVPQQLPVVQAPNGWFAENNGTVNVYVYPTSNGLPSGTCGAVPTASWIIYPSGDKWSTTTPTLASWCAATLTSTAVLALQGN